MLDLRKRLRGPPKGPRVSVVVTDIEGFSSEFSCLNQLSPDTRLLADCMELKVTTYCTADLMKKAPEDTMQALLMHNNLIEKAKWMNFGYTVEQEGGEQ